MRIFLCFFLRGLSVYLDQQNFNKGEPLDIGIGVVFWIFQWSFLVPLIGGIGGLYATYHWTFGGVFFLMRHSHWTHWTRRHQKRHITPIWRCFWCFVTQIIYGVRIRDESTLCYVWKDNTSSSYEDDSSWQRWFNSCVFCSTSILA